MRFVFLKLGVRIDQRIEVVQSRYVTNIQNAILHSVNPPTAVGPLIGRKTERVGDAACWITIIRHFPQLLYAETVNLGSRPWSRPSRWTSFLVSDPRTPSPSTVTFANRSTPGS